MALSVLRKQHRGRGSALLGILLHSENPHTKPKTAIFALDTPKPSEAIEGSDCESTPSCPTLGAAGAQDDCSGPSTTRGLRKRTFQKPAYCGYSPMNWRTVDKHLGCWILRHGVVGFVFKFGSNWTNFDVSVRGQPRTQAIRGWPGPSVDGLASPTEMKTFWVIKYLNIYSTNK